MVVAVYQIGDPTSSKKLVQAMETVKELRPSNLTVVVAGTKSDLQGEIEGEGLTERTLDEVRGYYGEGVKYMATSAKMDVGVGDVFNLCLEEFSKRKPSSVPPPIDEEHGMCKCWSPCVVM